MKASLIIATAAALFGWIATGPRPALAIPSACDSVAGNLVTNCGFEAANFSGWTQTGITDVVNVTDAPVHSGVFAAALGAIGGLNFLSQTFATTSGTSYNISLWLASDGLTPNEFDAEWNGTQLFGQTDIDQFEYQELTLTATGTGGNDTLTISSRNDDGFLNLDDVCVSAGSCAAVPEPAGLVLLSGALIGLGVVRRRR